MSQGADIDIRVVRDGRGPDCNVWSNFKQVIVFYNKILCLETFLHSVSLSLNCKLQVMYYVKCLKLYACMK